MASVMIFKWQSSWKIVWCHESHTICGPVWHQILASQTQCELFKISDHLLGRCSENSGIWYFTACAAFLAGSAWHLTWLLLPLALQSPRILRLHLHPGETAVRWPPAKARPRPLPAPISSPWALRTIPPARALTRCAEVSHHLYSARPWGGMCKPSWVGAGVRLRSLFWWFRVCYKTASRKTSR